ncbi:MAG TPA: hypothetical protein VNZ01_05500 [Solirubrobacteraceae bacterium]|jgi:hypothetical protein|nr:hypothetical protein [Solirubrobacteraceae bacterium]
MRVRIKRPRARQFRGPRRGPAPGAPVERSGAPQRSCSRQVKEQITRLVVEVGNRAQAWRSAANETELAFGWWTSAAPGERDEAAAVYVAATEREETAANEYRRAWETCCSTVP